MEAALLPGSAPDQSHPRGREAGRRNRRARAGAVQAGLCRCTARGVSAGEGAGPPALLQRGRPRGSTVGRWVGWWLSACRAIGCGTEALDGCLDSRGGRAPPACLPVPRPPQPSSCQHHAPAAAPSQPPGLPHPFQICPSPRPSRYLLSLPYTFSLPAPLPRLLPAPSDVPLPPPDTL